ncbi:MAG: hypothetical protein QXL01_07370 [Thermoplasmatales archaeon]
MNVFAGKNFRLYVDIGSSFLPFFSAFSSDGLVKCGEVSLNGTLKDVIASDNNKELYAHVTDELSGNFFYKIETKPNLKKTFLFSLGGKITVRPFIHENSIFVLLAGESEEPYWLNKASVATGTITWKHKLEEKQTPKMLWVGFDKIFILYEDKIKVSYKAVLPIEESFEIKLPDNVQSLPLISDGTMLLSTESDLYMLDLQESKITRRYKNEDQLSTLFFNGKYIIGGNKRGQITGYTTDGKRQWSFRAGGEITSISGLKGAVLVSSLDNTWYILRNKDGKLLRKFRFPSRITDALISENKALWYDIFTNSLNLINLSSGTAEGIFFPSNNETLIALGKASQELVYVATRNKIILLGYSKCPR